MEQDISRSLAAPTTVSLQNWKVIEEPISPAWNVLRRPNRSAVEPDSSRRLASTSV